MFPAARSSLFRSVPAAEYIILFDLSLLGFTLTAHPFYWSATGAICLQIYFREDLFSLINPDFIQN